MLRGIANSVWKCAAPPPFSEPGHTTAVPGADGTRHFNALIERLVRQSVA
jgi:hypothetical protein